MSYRERHWFSMGSTPIARFTMASLPGCCLLIDPDVTAAITKDESERISQIVDPSSSALVFQQSADAKKPTYVANSLNGHAVLRFVAATNQHLLSASGTLLSGGKGTVIAVYRINGWTAYPQTVLGSSDEATAVNFMWCRATDAEAAPNIGVSVQNGTGTLCTVIGGTSLSLSTTYIAHWYSSGSKIGVRVNGVKQALTTSSGTNSGGWWGTVDGRDNMSIGAVKRATTLRFFDGDLAYLIAFPYLLSPGQSRLADLYLADRFGVTL